MATSKIIKGVTVSRHDTAINWAKATRFVPKDGELIVFTADDVPLVSTTEGPIWTMYDNKGNLTRCHYNNQTDFTNGGPIQNLTIGTTIDGCMVDGTRVPYMNLDENGTYVDSGSYFNLTPSNKVRFKFGDGKTNVNLLPFVETNGSSSDGCKLTAIKTTDNSIVEFKNAKPIDRTFSIMTTLQGVPVYHYSNRIPHKTMQNSVSWYVFNSLSSCIDFNYFNKTDIYSYSYDLTNQTQDRGISCFDITYIDSPSTGDIELSVTIYNEQIATATVKKEHIYRIYTDIEIIRTINDGTHWDEEVYYNYEYIIHNLYILDKSTETILTIDENGLASISDISTPYNLFVVLSPDSSQHIEFSVSYNVQPTVNSEYNPDSDLPLNGQAVAEALSKIGSGDGCVPRKRLNDIGAPFDSVLAVDNSDYNTGDADGNGYGMPNDSSYKYISVIGDELGKDIYGAHHNTIVKRDSKGNLFTGTPVDNEDCANKKYVDDALAQSGGSSTLNIKDSTGSSSLQQIQDTGYTGIATKTKNPNAYALDTTLTDNEPIGATGAFASSFGGVTSAQGKRSFAEGTNTIAKGKYSHVEGDNSVALGNDSHAEGYATVSKGQASHAEGTGTQAQGDHSHSEGNGTIANGQDSHSEGNGTTASGEASHSEGENTIASGKNAHAEGTETQAVGNMSHSEGYGTKANLKGHAEGHFTEATGEAAHSEGANTKAIGNLSHSEGENTQSTGRNSHAEGWVTTAEGVSAHAEGWETHAKGANSHTQNRSTVANGNSSSAAGIFTIANYEGQFVIGKRNENKADTFFEVGNGADDSNRSNAFEVYADGSAKLIKTGDTDNSVVTKKYVDDAVASSGGGSGSSNVVSGTGTRAVLQVSDPSKTTFGGLIAGQEDLSLQEYVPDAAGINSAVLGDLSRAAGKRAVALGGYNVSIGASSLAAGYQTIAEGTGSFTTGTLTRAQSNYSSAFGCKTKALGVASHSEGDGTEARGTQAHSEGYYTKAIGATTHAEGNQTIASGDYSHSQGLGTQATGNSAHSQGMYTIASGIASHASGTGSIASGKYSFAHGNGVKAEQDNQFVIGKFNDNYTTSVFEIGYGASETERRNLFTVFNDGIAKLGNDYIATHEYVLNKFESFPLKANGTDSLYQGDNSATGISSAAFGSNTTATQHSSFASGNGTIASGLDAHSEGMNTEASGDHSHTEGWKSIASSACAHAEGCQTTASGENSHAEGQGSIASGINSHAQGEYTKAMGQSSHAQGSGSIASGTYSTAAGNQLRAGYDNQFIVGKFNNNKSDTFFEIGNGKDEDNRSNAFEVYTDGHAEIQTMGSTDKSITTKKYVDEKVSNMSMIGYADNLIQVGTESDFASLDPSSDSAPKFFVII